MKVTLVDDEPLALQYIEHQLRAAGGVEIAGMFEDSEALKAWLRTDDAETDAVFLDIQLPEVNGIELAEQLLEIKPHLRIVFITAYNDFAVKAFELNALDYLLKPVAVERLTITLQRLRAGLALASSSPPTTVPAARLLLFQHVQIETGDNGKPVSLRWRTLKAQELFLYLVHHRGKLVRKDALAELLWPDSEPDKAYALLYTAIYHIRKTIEPFGGHFHIANTSEGYILTMQGIGLDVEEWEQAVTEMTVDADTIEKYELLMQLYRGDYLQELNYWWAESERHRLQQLWFRACVELAEWYAAAGRPLKAIDKYHDIVKRQPQAEDAHFALMKLYADRGHHALVDQQYGLLEDALVEGLNVKPSRFIAEWYRDWRKASRK